MSARLYKRVYPIDQLREESQRSPTPGSARSRRSRHGSSRPKTAGSGVGSAGCRHGSKMHSPSRVVAGGGSNLYREHGRTPRDSLSAKSAPGGGRPKEDSKDPLERPGSIQPSASDHGLPDEDEEPRPKSREQKGPREREAEEKEKGDGEGGDGEKEEEDEEEDNEWGYTKKQMSDLEEAFNVFDVSREGTINPFKLFNVMRSLGLNPTEAEVQDLINAVDEDGNGTIEFDEFCEMMQKKINQPDNEDELKEAFRVFDHDENGLVNVDDMTSLFGALGFEFSQDEIKEMIHVGDPSGHMQVDFENFVRIAKSEPDIPLD